MKGALLTLKPITKAQAKFERDARAQGVEITWIPPP
jgi:hypothetical protein